MASTRPPKTYSPSFRTGRRSEGSGGVVGMVRCAGCDAWPGSLRSSMRTSREACSGWGRGRTVVLGSHSSRIDTRALDLHGRFDAAGGSGPEVPAAGAGPTPRRRNRQAATARPGADSRAAAPASATGGGGRSSCRRVIVDAGSWRSTSVRAASTAGRWTTGRRRRPRRRRWGECGAGCSVGSDVGALRSVCGGPRCGQHGGWVGGVVLVVGRGATGGAWAVQLARW